MSNLAQTVPRHVRSAKRIDTAMKIAGIISIVLSLGVLLALIIQVSVSGLQRIDTNFLLSYPSRLAERAGIFSAWVGTVWIVVVTGILAIPVGVAAGIYLEEYAPRNRFSRLLEINITNLAGVPSIIYGLLGLGLFIRFAGLGRSVLAGASTLALLILPIMILATREALRAVPQTLRESSYALGATKWQTTWHQVLPASISGVFTGIILALSRAIGETAPLIMIGALTYVAFLPASPLISEAPFVSLKGLFDPFTVLPIQIFNWVSRPQQGFAVNAAAGVVVLLLITLALNGLAIWARYRFYRKLHS